MPEYKNPLHFALVSGIDLYPGLGCLKNAAGDAVAFHQWLTDPDGGSVPPGNCEKVYADAAMTDKTPREKAVPYTEQLHLAISAIEKKGKEAVAGKAALWPQTRLYYYVSGHGLADGTRDAALLMANAGRPEWMGYHVSCRAVLEHFQRRQTFRELVIFADCCRDIEAGAPSADLPFDKAVRVNNGAVITVVAYGTLFGEAALEPDDGRGYFTEALLEALKGAGALPGVPIDSTTVAPVVKQLVIARTRDKAFQPQVTDWTSKPADPVVFRPAAAPLTRKVTLTFGPFAGRAQLQRGDYSLIEERAVVPGQIWIASLPAGMYKVVPVPAEAAAFRDKGRFEVSGEDIRVDF